MRLSDASKLKMHGKGLYSVSGRCMEHKQYIKQKNLLKNTGQAYLTGGRPKPAKATANELLV